MGCATKKYFVPSREVDKTINVPEGAKTLSPQFDVSIYPDTFAYNYTWLIVPRMSYGITNNLCYPLFPSPSLQYAVVNNNRIVDDTVFITNFNLSMGGGLTGFSVSPRDGFRPSLFLEVDLKCRFNNFFWCNVDVRFDPVFMHGWNEYFFLSGINLGVQVCNNLFALVAYDSHLNFYHIPANSITGSRVEHEGKITLGYNPNYYFGVRLYSGYVYCPDVHGGNRIPVGSSLLFSL
jgi:hypothetical protein